MAEKKRVLFCNINPTCYAISVQKEICKRHIQNLLSRETFAKTRTGEPLRCLISQHRSNLIKRGPGIDPQLQQNKAVNIALACGKINGILIRPGEVFSFYRCVGKATKRKGYKEGRFLQERRLIAGMGGGLCNLANTIHLLVLHSPLEVTEVYYHSDALAPETGKRVPMSSGTSVCYNYIDFRFRNPTDQTMQLMVWCEGDELRGELRGEREPECRFSVTEEGHHFEKIGEKYYRISKIYRESHDRKTGLLVDKRLVRDNKSEVMYDPALIPADSAR